MSKPTLKSLQDSIKYKFKSLSLLKKALTHPSYIQKDNKISYNYQRLEFLGDAVINLVLAEALYDLYPNEKEGILARYRAALIKGTFLSELALKLNLAPYILMSDTELECKGNFRKSTLEDVFEALIGAIYLDSSFQIVREFILSNYGNLNLHLNKIISKENPKGRLQEIIMKENSEAKITYKIVSESGPGHKKEFISKVFLNRKKIGEGEGSSKKQAEEKAALQALKKIQSK